MKITLTDTVEHAETFASGEAQHPTRDDGSTVSPFRHATRGDAVTCHYRLVEGLTVTVSDAMGQRLIDIGLAVPAQA